MKVKNVKILLITSILFCVAVAALVVAGNHLQNRNNLSESENLLNNQNENIAETTQYPFELVVTLEKTSYKQGAPVKVKWTLINVGDENVTLYHSADLFDFVVYNESFSHIFNYENVFGIYPVYYHLPPIYPGENITKIGIWDQIYDSAKFVNPGMSHEIYHEKVSPGIYYIAGAFQSPTYNVNMKTSSIKIQIMKITREEAIEISRNSSTMQEYIENSTQYDLCEADYWNVTWIQRMKEIKPEEYGNFPEDHGVWKITWVIFLKPYAVTSTTLTQFVDEETGEILLELRGVLLF